MSKKRFLAEVNTLDRNLSFSVNVKNQSVATRKLAEYITSLATLPKVARQKYAQIIPDAGEEDLVEEIFDEFREMYLAKSAWLAHLTLNRGKRTPEVLKSSRWKHYEPDARVSEAFLKVAEGLAERSEILQKEYKECGDMLPAQIWFDHEISILFDAFKQSGLGLAFGLPFIAEAPNPIGKRERYNSQVQTFKFLEDPGVHSLPEGTASGVHLGSVNLMSVEIARLAYNEDDFLNDQDLIDVFWKPYLKIVRWANNKSKNNKHLHSHTILPGGKEFYSRKGPQSPNIIKQCNNIADFEL